MSVFRLEGFFFFSLNSRCIVNAASDTEHGFGNTPLIGGDPVILCKDASGQPGEEQSTKDPAVSSQHGGDQKDGSTTQRGEKQRPVIENWRRRREISIFSVSLTGLNVFFILLWFL